MRATSRSRSVEPSVLTRSRMAPNCPGVCSRDCELMVADIGCPAMAGVPPSWPAETCAFCASIAARTSAGVSEKL